MRNAESTRLNLNVRKAPCVIFLWIPPKIGFEELLGCFNKKVENPVFECSYMKAALRNFLVVLVGWKPLFLSRSSSADAVLWNHLHMLSKRWRFQFLDLKSLTLQSFFLFLALKEPIQQQIVNRQKLQLANSSYNQLEKSETKAQPAEVKFEY